MDAIPVFSQIKSAVQWIFKDAEGAKQTQINFSRQCPVVSQVRSMVEASKGDNAAALETQKQCGKFFLCVVNGIPVVGHIKGTVHYALGDKEEGDAAMKAASHTSAVIGGGVGGFLLGGPVGAVAGGVGAGVAVDSAITATDSAINKTLVPYGVFEAISDPTNPGKWCDAAGGVVLDGIAGRCAGKVVQQVQLKNVSKPSAIVDTIMNDKPIPIPVMEILKQASVIVMPIGKQLYLKIIRKIQAHLEKQIHGGLNFEKPCKVNMSELEAESQEAAAEKLGVSVKINGKVFEVYLRGKLIILHVENKAYYVNNSGEMEQMKKGVKIDLFDSENLRVKTGVECRTEVTAQAQMGPCEYVNDSNKLLGKKPTHQTISELVYDPEQNQIIWGRCEENENVQEEHEKLNIPVPRRGMHKV